MTKEICDIEKKHEIVRDFANGYNRLLPYEQNFKPETIELAKIIGEKDRYYFPLIELEFLLTKFTADEILNRIYSQYEKELHPEYKKVSEIDFDDLYVPYRGNFYYIECFNLEDVWKKFENHPDTKEFWLIGNIELKTKKIGVDVQFTFDTKREKWMIAKVEKYEDVEETYY